MLDNYLLTELVTFAQTGTLAKTAASLNVTQPTVTRGMQKLETDLGVHLFDRQPNRLSLTATGELAAKEAATILAANRSAVDRIRQFDRHRQQLKVGSTIPGPFILFKTLAIPDNVVLDPQQLPTTDWETRLTNHDYSLILGPAPTKTPGIDSHYLGTESLIVHLNQFMMIANQASVTFAELKDLRFLVLNDIGPWRAIIQSAIPNAKFFYQKERDAFLEISKFSDFPYFSTNLSPLDPVLKTAGTDDSRLPIPISDDDAHMQTYATYLHEDRERVLPLIHQLEAAWPKATSRK